MVNSIWIFEILILTVGVGWLGAGRSSYSYQSVHRDFPPFPIDEANRWLCMVFGLCAFNPSQAEKPGFRVIHEWSQLEFDYPSEASRQADVASGTFIPGMPAPIDVDVHYNFVDPKKDRVFVTIPRFQAGSPIALGVVTDRKLNNNPIVAPYPSWDWHTNPELCKRDRIVSVYRVQIDECQRLWVLDTGRLINNLTCAPQILAFDLQTDQLIHRYEIPLDQVESRSILVTPIVDVRDSHSRCKDTFVYAADCQTYSIIVHDARRNISWRATDNTMYPWPPYGTYNIAGDSFKLMDGVLGMSLSPYRPGEDRILFYHAMSSPTENWVYTSDLRDRQRFLQGPTQSPQIFHTYTGQRNTQSCAEAVDKDGIMFFGLLSNITVDCWNTHEPYSPKTIDVVASNPSTLQFPSGMKVISDNRAIQQLWVLTSRFQKVADGSLNPAEINFRILAARIPDLLAGTKCKSGRNNRPGGQVGGFNPAGGNYLPRGNSRAKN